MKILKKVALISALSVLVVALGACNRNMMGRHMNSMSGNMGNHMNQNSVPDTQYRPSVNEDLGDILSWQDAVKSGKENSNTGASVLILCEMEESNGKLVYELEFLNTSGQIVEMEVDAVGGNVLKTNTDDDAEDEASELLKVSLTPEQAVGMALGSVDNSTFYSLELDTQWGGAATYDIEVVDAAALKWEVRIDAATQKILSRIQDKIGNEGSFSITPDLARKTAVDANGGSIGRCVLEDYSGNLAYYEVLGVDSNGAAYEMHINVTTGHHESNPNANCNNDSNGNCQNSNHNHGKGGNCDYDNSGNCQNGNHNHGKGGNCNYDNSGNCQNGNHNHNKGHGGGDGRGHGRGNHN